jgi:hypothetical protein
MATHKRDRLRGRRITFWFWGCFILSQLGAGLLLDHCLPQIRFPRAFQQFRALGRLPHSPDIVFLGSSRTESSLHDWTISQSMRHFTGDESIVAFNANVPGGDLISAEYVWQGLRRRGAHPAVLVIEVCPEEVNHLNDWLKLHVFRQLGWTDIPTYAEEVCRTKHLNRLAQARLLPLYIHRYELWKAAVQSLREVLLRPSATAKWVVPPGYQDMSALAEKEQALRPEQRAESDAGVHGVERCLRNYRPGGTSAKALKRILGQCKEEGIAVLLVGIPVSSVHRKVYTRFIEGRFGVYMKHLEQAYGCRYVDCRDQVPDWLFRDNHHALPLGGDYFSQRFAWEVLLPIWSQVKPGGRPVIAAR